MTIVRWTSSSGATSMAICLLATIAACAGDTLPTESDARKLLEARIAEEASNRIQLVRFTKTNGQAAEFGGVQLYTLEWEATIEFTEDCLWRPGRLWRESGVPSFETGEYRQLDGASSWAKFNLKNAGWMEVEGGTREEIAGSFSFETTEAGWRTSDGHVIQ